MALVEYHYEPTMDEFKAGFPKTVGIDIKQVGIGTPKVAPSLGSLPLADVGVDISFKCPGYPTCKRAAGACQFTQKKGFSLDLTKLIPGIPAIPTFNMIVFPNYSASVKVPPDSFNPLKCPNYPSK